MTNEESKAREILLSVYEARRDHDRISPSWLATEVMQKLDPLRVSHPVEYAMAHLQFRQLARSVCANTWEKGDQDQSEQHKLFPDLQSRYPIAIRSRDDDPVYVRLELLTRKDAAFNVARLRKEGVAKLEHADKLEAWDANRESAVA